MSEKADQRQVTGKVVAMGLLRLEDDDGHETLGVLVEIGNRDDVRAVGVMRDVVLSEAQEPAALQTTSTGSEPGESDDDRRQRQGGSAAASGGPLPGVGTDRSGARGGADAPDLTPPSEDAERDRLIRTIQQAHGYLTGEWEGEVPDSFKMKTVADLLFNQLHASGALPPEDGERVLLWHAQLGYWLGAEKHGPGFTQDYREAVSFTRAYAETQIEGAGDDLPSFIRIATLDGGIEHDGGECPVPRDLLVVVDYDGTADLDDLEPKEAGRWAWVGAARFRPAPPESKAEVVVCRHDDVYACIHCGQGTRVQRKCTRCHMPPSKCWCALLRPEPDTPALTERERPATEWRVRQIVAEMVRNERVGGSSMCRDCADTETPGLCDTRGLLCSVPWAVKRASALGGGEAGL